MDRKLKNIIITESGRNKKYIPVIGGGGKGNFPKRINRKEHGDLIEAQFLFAWDEARKKESKSNVSALSTNEGVYLQIKGESGYDLITKSLENIGQKIRLLNVKHDEEDTTCATIFVPKSKKDFFIKKIDKYKRKEKGTEVIATIENINLAMISSFWIGDKKLIPHNENMWCEIWLRYDENENIDNVFDEFKDICTKNNINIKDEKIKFPERLVVGVNANIHTLNILQENSCRIAEIRKMTSLVSFFSDLEYYEQRQWTRDLVGRLDISNQSNTSVCLLDTGVNNGHPLLEKILKDEDKHSIGKYINNPDDTTGHGTNMAGIATYFNLEEKLESKEIINVNHFLESVKILNEKSDNQEELYGSITREAIYLVEIQNPKTNRSFCMPITVKPTIENDGRPSSWSGAIDSFIAGVDDGELKRLMFISAGNTDTKKITNTNEMYTAIINHAVEDPGQSWNAITVGAYTEKDQVENEKYKPLVKAGELSPFTSSSMTWDKKWPIKPEVLFEGGNVLTDGGKSYTSTELYLLTTGRQYLTNKPFEIFGMTSAATAQAAWFSASIWHNYPNLWPETIRALIIHSASWTEEMKKNIFMGSIKQNRKDYRELLRMCGYGVPNLEKAIWSAANSVNIIIEDELQPFIKKGSSYTSNEMKLHVLPWAKALLQENKDIDVKIRITLSYYIEPGPGEIGWKDKYRYPSCGLIFDINQPMENEKSFLKRISDAMRSDGETVFSINDSSKWLIGSTNRNVGSIHSDIWEGKASDLAECNMIIIYPKTGWWKLRSNLKRYNSKLRYSLIITLETPKNEIDLYNEIMTEIKNKTAMKTVISAI
ncbi:MAG: S8 family peptidase [Fusobacteriaceae bacterium]|jgi:hypothetical protein|nr:S8 family peptidase [Fusobacteriaceae bacterium]